MANDQPLDEFWNSVLDLQESPKCTPLSDSEPPESHLAVRQSRGTVTVPHGCQHEPNVRHRSIQLIRNRMVNIS